MLVSRWWADIIHGRSLYHSVYIKNEEMFRYFLKTIKQKPELANNVEHLVLWQDGPSDLSEKDIIKLFPNLKTLDYSRFNNPHIAKDTLNDNTPPLPLKNKLTYVRDTSECFMTRLGLAEGLFTHLITLDLSFPIDYSYKGNPMLSLLKNMPVLKYLGLDNTIITIDDFENLHANIPSLESLKISEMRLILSNFPAKIKPTSAFTSLEVYGEFEDPQEDDTSTIY